MFEPIVTCCPSRSYLFARSAVYPTPLATSRGVRGTDTGIHAFVVADDIRRLAFARRRVYLRGRREPVYALESAVPVGAGGGAMWWVNTNSLPGDIGDLSDS